MPTLTPRRTHEPLCLDCDSLEDPSAADIAPNDTHNEDVPHATTLTTRIATIITVVLPFVGLAAAVFLLWGIAFSWVHLIVLVVMYVLTGLGITVGYHRFFTHKAFDTPRWIAFTLGVLGSMAVQGPVLQWAALHRSHHQHSDDEGDPHSPHASRGRLWGVLGFLKGLWHAHAGWLFTTNRPGLGRYVRDLRKDRVVRTVSLLFPLWVVLGMLIPALLGGLLTLSWSGMLLGFLWGGLVRIFLVHHVTWSVNSVCHIWGSRPFQSHDESRNNVLFGVLAMGEGWHNNHHAFPTSARHGLSWWQFDLSYYVIRAMGVLGLAHNIRVPAPERVLAKRRDRAKSPSRSEDPSPESLKGSMAQYKFERHLKFSSDPIYDKVLVAGSAAPRSGIYRCDGCGLEITVHGAQALPDGEHHPHAASQKLIRWKLIVSDGGSPSPDAPAPTWNTPKGPAKR